ncbi:MAG: hypothetical protein QOE90_417 [Thermoplasmata archaeon]|nr:hypothetical protein [Thermoplasmata archaeon]
MEAQNARLRETGPARDPARAAVDRDGRDTRRRLARHELTRPPSTAEAKATAAAPGRPRDRDALTGILARASARTRRTIRRNAPNQPGHHPRPRGRRSDRSASAPRACAMQLDVWSLLPSHGLTGSWRHAGGASPGGPATCTTWTAGDRTRAGQPIAIGEGPGPGNGVAAGRLGAPRPGRTPVAPPCRGKAGGLARGTDRPDHAATPRASELRTLLAVLIPPSASERARGLGPILRTCPPGMQSGGTTRARSEPAREPE